MSHLHIYKRSDCQDRLGTNIGKALKKQNDTLQANIVGARYGMGPEPKLSQEDKDTDYNCCELFNATNPPPADWRTRYPVRKTRLSRWPFVLLK